MRKKGDAIFKLLCITKNIIIKIFNAARNFLKKYRKRDILRFVISILLLCMLLFFTLMTLMYSSELILINGWGSLDEDAWAASAIFGYFSIFLAILFFAINFKKKWVFVISLLLTLLNIYSMMQADKIAEMFLP